MSTKRNVLVKKKWSLIRDKGVPVPYQHEERSKSSKRVEGEGEDEGSLQRGGLLVQPSERRTVKSRGHLQIQSETKIERRKKRLGGGTTSWL